MSCNIGCEALTEHEIAECGERSYGPITAIGLLDCSNTSITDFSNASQLNAAIAAGQLTIIKDIMAELPAGSPALIDALSGDNTLQEWSGDDLSVALMDGAFNSNNLDLYEQLKTRAYHPILYLGREGKTLHWRNPARLISQIVVQKDKAQPIRFDGVLNWFARTSPVLTNSAPASVWQ